VCRSSASYRVATSSTNTTRRLADSTGCGCVFLERLFAQDLKCAEKPWCTSTESTDDPALRVPQPIGSLSLRVTRQKRSKATETRKLQLVRARSDNAVAEVHSSTRDFRSPFGSARGRCGVGGHARTEGPRLLRAKRVRDLSYRG